MVGITRKTGIPVAGRDRCVPPCGWSRRPLESVAVLAGWLGRQRIPTLRGQGMGVREIARCIGRLPRRSAGDYAESASPRQEHLTNANLTRARLRNRAWRVRRARLVEDAYLLQVVQDQLVQDWSPEHVAQHLRRTYPDRPDWHAVYHGGSIRSGRIAYYAHLLNDQTWNINKNNS